MANAEKEALGEEREALQDKIEAATTAIAGVEGARGGFGGEEGGVWAVSGQGGMPIEQLVVYCLSSVLRTMMCAPVCRCPFAKC